MEAIRVNESNRETIEKNQPLGSTYGIFTYIYHKNQLNVDEYTRHMDPMGNDPADLCWPCLKKGNFLSWQWHMKLMKLPYF